MLSTNLHDMCVVTNIKCILLPGFMAVALSRFSRSRKIYGFVILTFSILLASYSFGFWSLNVKSQKLGGKTRYVVRIIVVSEYVLVLPFWSRV